MQLSDHFSLDELTHTDVRGLDNTCPPELMIDLRATAQVLERVRAELGRQCGREVPIIVTSAYRSPRVNAHVGGSPHSDHMRAVACDFKAPAFGTPLDVCRALAPHLATLGIGQIIHEFGRWVHISRATPVRDINRVLTISAAGTVPGLHPVLA